MLAFDEEAYSPPDAGKPMRAVAGPVAAAIGWFPYYPEVQGLPECELKAHRFASAAILPAAMGELFRSGNHRPKDHIRDGDEFARELMLRDYRAAFAIEHPVLQLDENGRPCAFTFRHLYRVGYTPGRAGLNTRHLPGIGSCHHTVDFLADRVVLDYFPRFRLGKLANVAGRLMTGHWAPFASMAVHYELWTDGAARAFFRGSLVPSQSYYQDWKLCGEYNVLQCTAYQFDDFVEAGDGRDAKVVPMASFEVQQ